jgi:glycerol-3-phosphate dehydrogenase
MNDIIILGAGVIGAFIARELSKYELNIIVIDKENDVGNFTSMANSALIHSGYDPIPGTLKAKLNVIGNKMYEHIAKELDVIYKRIGSLTVIKDSSKLHELQKLKQRGDANGVTTYIISRDELLKKEPLLSKDIYAALYAPSAAIIDPFELVVHLMENAIDNGVKLYLNEEVIDIINNNDHYQVVTTKNKHIGKIIINATGINTDVITDMVSKPHFKITPRQGSYFVLDHFDDSFLNHIIFQLPKKHSKGVVITPTYSHNYLVGPSSNFVEDRNTLATDPLTMDKIKKEALNIIPDIPFDKVIRTFSGLRATSTNDDFIIQHVENQPRFIIVGGIDSPGLAAAPAIAEMVINQLVSKVIPLKIKHNYNPRIRPLIRPKQMNSKQLQELISENPSFGHIICRCEHVSEGQLLDALSRSCPPRTIKAVKKRLRAGFGRCQGGFCQPLVLQILADYYQTSLMDIAYDEEETNILKAETKR